MTDALWLIAGYIGFLTVVSGLSWYGLRRLGPEEPL